MKFKALHGAGLVLAAGLFATTEPNAGALLLPMKVPGGILLVGASFTFLLDNLSDLYRPRVQD